MFFRFWGAGDDFIHELTTRQLDKQKTDFDGAQVQLETLFLIFGGYHFYQP